MTRQNSIRKEILLQLYASRLPLSVEHMQREAKKNDYDYTVTEMKNESQFLADDSLIVQVANPGSTEIKYRILSAGVRQYEQTYAA